MQHLPDNTNAPLPITELQAIAKVYAETLEAEAGFLPYCWQPGDLIPAAVEERLDPNTLPDRQAVVDAYESWRESEVRALAEAVNELRIRLTCDTDFYEDGFRRTLFEFVSPDIPIRLTVSLDDSFDVSVGLPGDPGYVCFSGRLHGHPIVLLLRRWFRSDDHIERVRRITRKLGLSSAPVSTRHHRAVQMHQAVA